MNSGGLKKCVSDVRLIVLAAAVSWGGVQLVCAELPGTNEISRNTAGRTLRVALDDEHRWDALKYDKRAPHTLRFSASGLEISVNRSAMPLFYPLPQVVRVNSMRIQGRIVGRIRVTPEKQGKKGYDDYSLRVGLVEPGTTRLTAHERRTAADWVKALFDLTPAQRGIRKVHFLNLGTAKSQIGRSRQHPMSELLSEIVVAAPQPDGSFDYVHLFDPPMETCAVWVSVDGDDTKSSYKTIINQVELQTIP